MNIAARRHDEPRSPALFLAMTCAQSLSEKARAYPHSQHPLLTSMCANRYVV